MTRKGYGAGLREVDFAGKTEAARKTTNVWVEDETNKKIKDLIPGGILGRETALVLTNAIYFNGDWASQFGKKATTDAPFTLADDKKVQVAMMRQKGKFRYFETKDFQALALPYVKDELSMVVFLPKDYKGLPNFEGSLAATNLEKWLSGMRRREVQVYLPRFKLTYKNRLDETLKSMGMSDAFGGGADFSGMNGRKDLFISAVLHKAFVDVNEEGTEAAAATGVVMGGTSVRPRPVVFRADHPFLFLIRDNKSGSILFMGRLVKPE